MSLFKASVRNFTLRKQDVSRRHVGWHNRQTLSCSLDECALVVIVGNNVLIARFHFPTILLRSLHCWLVVSSWA